MRRVEDVMLEGELWETPGVLYCIVRRWDTCSAECYTALNLDEGKMMFLWDVASQVRNGWFTRVSSASEE